MEQRAAELGMNLSDLARTTGVDRETLRKLRYGLMGKRGAAPRTKLALEEGLRWAPGSIDAGASGGEPTPLNVIPFNRPTDSTSTDPTAVEILDPRGKPYLDAQGVPVTPGGVNLVLEAALRYGGVDSWRRALTDMAHRYGLPMSDPDE